jgi:hypothetical protein
MNHDPVDAVPRNPDTAPLEPDAHGQAALLLAESILHALVETRTLTLNMALSAIQTTCEVKREVAELSGESNGRMNESLDLLKAIASSFAVDAEKQRDYSND